MYAASEILRTPPRDLPLGTRNELQRIGSRCQDANSGGTAELLLKSVLPSDSASDQQEDSLSQILEESGFDRIQHEQIRSDLLAGRIGLSQNRLSANTSIQDVTVRDVVDVRDGVDAKYIELGKSAIKSGKIGVVTLAAGVGSRWTQGAGVVKALNPFCRMGGQFRSFLDVHVAKSKQDRVIPHLVLAVGDKPVGLIVQVVNQA